MVLKLFTNLVKGKRFGVRVQRLTESGKSGLAEAMASAISVDNAGGLVAVGELERYNEVHEIVFPNLSRNTQKHV